MSYIDEAGYAARFTQRELDQFAATGGGLSFADAEQDAAELIDSYLAAIPNRTFAVPLEVPPARIVGIAADLTRYQLWALRASDEVRKRRDEALEYLKDLVAGKATLLVDADMPEDPKAMADRVGFAAAPRVFTGRSLARFVGPSYIDDDPAEDFRRA